MVQSGAPKTAGPAAPPAMVWWVVVATTAVQAEISFAVLALTGIAPEAARNLGVPSSYVGYHISVAYAAGILSSLPMGPAIAKWGACRISQASMLLGAAGSALAAVPTLGVVAIGSIVMGIGLGMTVPAASHLLARFAPETRRNLIFSLKQTGVPLGGMLAGALGPPIAVAFGWRWTLATVVFGALVLVLLLQFARARWDDDRKPEIALRIEPTEGLRLMLSRPELAWLAALGFFLGVIQLCMVSFLVTLLVADVGLDLVAAGLVLSAVQATGVAGRILWGWAADRLRSGIAVLAIQSIWTTVGVLAVATLSPEWPYLAILALFVALAASAVGWNGVYLAEVARMAPAGQVGAATGGGVSTVFLGALVGPSLFAAAHGFVGGYTATFGLLGAAGFAAIGCALAARRAAAVFRSPGQRL